MFIYLRIWYCSLFILILRSCHLNSRGMHLPFPIVFFKKEYQDIFPSCSKISWLLHALITSLHMNPFQTFTVDRANVGNEVVLTSSRHDACSDHLKGRRETTSLSVDLLPQLGTLQKNTPLHLQKERAFLKCYFHLQRGFPLPHSSPPPPWRRPGMVYLTVEVEDDYMVVGSPSDWSRERPSLSAGPSSNSPPSLLPGFGEPGSSPPPLWQ